MHLVSAGKKAHYMMCSKRFDIHPHPFMDSSSMPTFLSAFVHFRALERFSVPRHRRLIKIMRVGEISVASTLATCSFLGVLAKPSELSKTHRCKGRRPCSPRASCWHSTRLPWSLGGLSFQFDGKWVPRNSLESCIRLPGAEKVAIRKVRASAADKLVSEERRGTVLRVPGFLFSVN